MKLVLVVIFCIAGAFAAELTPEQRGIFSNFNIGFTSNEYLMLLNILQDDYSRLFPQIDKSDVSGFSKKAADVISFLTESFNILGQNPPDPDVLNALANMIREIEISKNDFCEFRIAMTSFLKKQFLWEPQVQDDWTNAFDAIYFETFKKENTV